MKGEPGLSADGEGTDGAGVCSGAMKGAGRKETVLGCSQEGSQKTGAQSGLFCTTASGSLKKTEQ